MVVKDDLNVLSTKTFTFMGHGQNEKEKTIRTLPWKIAEPIAVISLDVS